MSSYTIPNVVAQHPRGDRIMDVYSQLLTERILRKIFDIENFREILRTQETATKLDLNGQASPCQPTEAIPTAVPTGKAA